MSLPRRVGSEADRTVLAGGNEILDPFLGSGQTALVALREGRQCVGYDIEERYLKLAQHRIVNPPPKREYNLLPKFEKIAATG